MVNARLPKVARLAAYAVLVTCTVTFGCQQTTAEPDDDSPAQAPTIFTPSDPIKNGYIPTATVALKVFEAIANPVYGEEHIDMNRPFMATLVGTVWTVTGQDQKATEYPLGGGRIHAKIDKRSGKVLEMYAEK